MEVSERLKIKGNVVIKLFDKNGKLKAERKIDNLVMSAGAQYYAEQGAGEAPTEGFVAGLMGLGSAGNAPAAGSTRADITTKIAGSELSFDGTYPQTDDGDADNTGAGVTVTTFLRTYAPGEGTDSAIDRVYITDSAPVAAEPLLMYAVFAAVNKAAGDTLKVFVNHTLTPV